MSVATKLKSEFDVYQTSTDALLKEFKNGELYVEDPQQYFGMIVTICNYFKSCVNKFERNMNEIITEGHEFQEKKNYVGGLDYIAEGFDFLDDYVQHICADFQDFKNTITAIVPKENLEGRCEIEFNLVDHKIDDLDKYVERVRTEVLSYFMSKLTDTELEQRAI